MTSQELTFNHTAHKEMWKWLSENPTALKSKWPGWERYPEGEWLCFACEYADYQGEDENCKNCPLIWPYKCCYAIYKGERGRLYPMWVDALYESNTLERRKELALQIMNLPVKPDVKCI